MIATNVKGMLADLLLFVTVSFVGLEYIWPEHCGVRRGAGMKGIILRAARRCSGPRSMSSSEWRLRARVDGSLFYHSVARPRPRSVRTRRDALRLGAGAGSGAVERIGSDPRALASCRKTRRTAGFNIPRYAATSSAALRSAKGSLCPSLTKGAAGADVTAIPWKKNSIGTSKTLLNSKRRPALIRFFPCSYLYTC